MSAGSSSSAGAGVLRDPVLDAQLGREGYAIVPLVEREVAAELLEVFRRLHPGSGDGFEADLNNSDSEYRRAVARETATRLTDVLAATLVDQEPFLWSFLCKWPGEPEDLYLHRDWWFVDERSGARSHLVWLALQDIDRTNGALKILPKSHRLDSEPTGTHLAPSWLDEARSLEHRLYSPAVRAGDAIVMDHALVHGSYRSTSERPRVALGCAVRRVDEPLVHLRRDDDHVASMYHVDHDFFTTYTPDGLMQSAPDLRPFETIRADHHQRHLTFDVDGRLDRLDRRRTFDLIRDRVRRR